MKLLPFHFNFSLSSPSKQPFFSSIQFITWNIHCVGNSVFKLTSSIVLIILFSSFTLYAPKCDSFKLKTTRTFECFVWDRFLKNDDAFKWVLQVFERSEKILYGKMLVIIKEIYSWLSSRNCQTTDSNVVNYSVSADTNNTFTIRHSTLLYLCGLIQFRDLGDNLWPTICICNNTNLTENCMVIIGLLA